MDNLGILDISFERDSCGIVKANHLFELLPTEGTCRDKEVDEVIKKWRDRIREGQEDGDVLCAVGTQHSIYQFVPANFFSKILHVNSIAFQSIENLSLMYNAHCTIFRQLSLVNINCGSQMQGDSLRLHGC